MQPIFAIVEYKGNGEFNLITVDCTPMIEDGADKEGIEDWAIEKNHNEAYELFNHRFFDTEAQAKEWAKNNHWID